MKFGQLNDDDKEVLAALHNIIIAHWNEDAASDWDAYQVHGRGAVLLDFRPFTEPPDHLPLSGYIRPRDIKVEGDDIQELKRLLESYKPENEIIFVIYTPLSDTVIELIAAFEGRLPPPEAAAHLKAGMN
jgi:hypothetical protein